MTRYAIRNKKTGYVSGDYENLANLNKGIGQVRVKFNKGYHQVDGSLSFSDWAKDHEIVILQEISKTEISE